MCGIVAYVGSNKSKNILLDGLKRLEYRGYDSAGVALYAAEKEDFLIQRSVGAVVELETLCSNWGLAEHQGIAHTRWATHGAPTEINAHPHRAQCVVLVHNGIIENHADIKTRLAKEKITFHSQTDTEVFASLVEYHREQFSQNKEKLFELLSVEEKKNIVLRALTEAMKDAVGHYAVVFMVQGLRGYIFGAQNGAPLVAGLSADGCLVASDIQALLPYTQRVRFLPVGTVFCASQNNFSAFDALTLKPVSLEEETIEWSQDQVAKDGFEHFMLKETFQQPLIVADTLSGRLPEKVGDPFLWDNMQAHQKLWKDAKKIYLIACGTAYHAGLVAKYYFEKWAHISVEVDFASEFRYRSPVFEAGTVVGVISQSGETADTLAALRLANAAKVPTFSVCNVPRSTIARESLYQYPTKAGPEVGVASTKAFTAQVTVLAALALDLATSRGYKDVPQFLSRLPHDMEVVLQDAARFQSLGAALKNKKTIFFVGRGTMYPIALEGALKLKEITYRHAEGYAAGELKHGPIALVDENLVAIVLAPTDELLQKTISNLEEIRSRGGKILGIGEVGNESFMKLCDDYIPMPKAPWGTNPLLYVIPLQLISYGLAKELGCNIDKPRNLAKSVTVE